VLLSSRGLRINDKGELQKAAVASTSPTRRAWQARRDVEAGCLLRGEHPDASGTATSSVAVLEASAYRGSGVPAARERRVGIDRVSA